MEIKVIEPRLFIKTVGGGSYAYRIGDTLKFKYLGVFDHRITTEGVFCGLLDNGMIRLCDTKGVLMEIHISDIVEILD